MAWSRGSTSQPPQPPHLTPLNFLLWGFVKDRVYILPMPINLNHLKIKYEQQLQKLISLPCKMFGMKLSYHLDVCRATNAGHIELA
jgi:hypothetical protein